MRKKVVETDRLYCVHISSEDDPLIRKFQLANDHGGFLAEYLKKEALSDEDNFRMRTYLVYDKRTSELVGYYSLKAGFVSSKENSNFFNFGFDSIPGVELANYYKYLGFSRLNRMQERSMHRRIRPNYDEGCIFMYQQL